MYKATVLHVLQFSGNTCVEHLSSVRSYKADLIFQKMK